MISVKDLSSVVCKLSAVTILYRHKLIDRPHFHGTKLQLLHTTAPLCWHCLVKNDWLVFQ